MSFVVGVDGRVIDPVIEDSTNPIFESVARNAVLEWTYEPATLNGAPVEQAYNRVGIVFRLNPTPQATSSKFARQYEEITEQLTNDQLEPAERSIRKLAASEGLLISERSYLSLLQANLSKRREALSSQLRSLSRAIIEDGKFLDREHYSGALTELYIAQVQDQQFAAANATYRRLSDLSPVPDLITRGAEITRDLLAQRPVIGRSGRIPMQSDIDAGTAVRLWSHTLLRRELAFQSHRHDHRREGVEASGELG